MGIAKKIFLSEAVFKSHSTRFGVLKCARCGELLRVGDQIISKRVMSVYPKMFRRKKVAVSIMKRAGRACSLNVDLSARFNIAMKLESFYWEKTVEDIELYLFFIMECLRYTVGSLGSR